MELIYMPSVYGDQWYVYCLDSNRAKVLPLEINSNPSENRESFKGSSW